MLSKFATVSTYYICHSSLSLSRNSTLHTCAPRSSDLKIIRIFAFHKNQVYTFAFALLWVTKQKLISNTDFQLLWGNSTKLCQSAADFQTSALVKREWIDLQGENLWCVIQCTHKGEPRVGQITQCQERVWALTSVLGLIQWDSSLFGLSL